MGSEDDWVVGVRKPGYIALLELDERNPVDEQAFQEVVAYLEAFFRLEVRVVQVPSLPIAPIGWKALLERVTHPLTSRPGRPDSTVETQLSGPELLGCLKLLRQLKLEDHGIAIDGAEVILAFTGAELYDSSVGVVSGEPVPAERCKKTAYLSVEQRVGGISLSTILVSASGGMAYRNYLRQLLTLTSHSVLTLLGLRTCQSKQCLAYLKPFNPAVTPLYLSAAYEEMLLNRVLPGATREELCSAAAARYREMGQVLSLAAGRLDLVCLSRRRYAEFEEEVDWLKVAEELMLESTAERKKAVSGSPVAMGRRRSLASCLAQVHDGQPPMTLKRTFTEPYLKRTCLVDMSMSLPYRHDCGDMTRWSKVVTNKQHTAGGHYLELGGSLKPKLIGTFLDAGLNASMLRPNQEHKEEDPLRLDLTYGSYVTRKDLAKTWGRTHSDEDLDKYWQASCRIKKEVSLPNLPKVRNRSATWSRGLSGHHTH